MLTFELFITDNDCLKMGKFLFILFLILSSISFSQTSLKSKYFGLYEGVIDAYKMDTGDALLEVSETTISVNLQDKALEIKIGKSTFNGSYTVLFEAENYIVLEAHLTNQPINERIVVYKKGNKISRDGLYPQPSALMYKTK